MWLWLVPCRSRSRTASPSNNGKQRLALLHTMYRSQSTVQQGDKSLRLTTVEYYADYSIYFEKGMRGSEPPMHNGQLEGCCILDLDFGLVNLALLIWKIAATH
jgi:hypothetical protein